MHKSIKDSILEAVDIVGLIGERVALRRKGKDFIGLCPFHPDTRPSLSVSPTKQIFKCWSCGAGGDAIRYVQLRDRVDFRGALETLGRWAGIEYRRPGAADARSNALREQLQSILQWAAEHFRRNFQDPRLGASARHYAARRSLSDETLERFRVGFAPDARENLIAAARKSGTSVDLLQQAGLVGVGERGDAYDRFRNRLMFPIDDAMGRTVAFGGRTLGEDPAKYLNSPETALFAKSRILFGLHLARDAIQARGQAVVVEGYLDAVLLHQYGIRHAVATLGTALTDAHARLLGPLCRSVVLCFDGDAAGVRAADRAVEIALRGRLDVRVAVLPAGKDPADLVIEAGATGFEAALQCSVPALEFKWSLTEQAFAGEAADGRRAAVAQFLEFVARITQSGAVDPVEQGLLVGRLSGLLSVPPEFVYDLLARLRRPAPRAAASPDVAESSDYDALTRGLPRSLVTAMEEVFGWAALDAACWRRVDDRVLRAARLCRPWNRLAETLTTLARREAGYERQDVLAACDEGAVVELLSRALAHVGGDADPPSAFEAACERLRMEYEARGMAELRGPLRKSDGADAAAHDAYVAFLDMARRQNASLSPECRGRDLALEGRSG